MKLFKKGELLIKVSAVRGEEADFDPYGSISVGSLDLFEAHRAYIKMNKKKGALLKIKVRVPSGTLINELSKGITNVNVGGCTGQILID